jgi:Fe-Mn family superoxide dismutase
LINRDFGSLQLFVERFRGNALAKFGSGWTWLVLGADARLSVVNSDDADTPLRHGKAPLLTCDVWEHAYYLDYRNERPRYVATFLEQVNWDFVQANLTAASPPLKAAV